MSTYPPGSGGIGRRIEEAMELIELELRHAIAYVNDAVVPQVRRESITAMRRIAETLDTLANRIEGCEPNAGPGRRPGAAQNPPQGQAGGPTPSPAPGQAKDTRA